MTTNSMKLNPQGGDLRDFLAVDRMINTWPRRGVTDPAKVLVVKLHFPRNFVRMFRPEFADLVKSGAKLQTVRPYPKRPSDQPQPGDTQSLRKWSGRPYNSPQVVLRDDSEITTVHSIEFREDGTMAIAGIVLTIGQAERFAIADGFRGVNAMFGFFLREYGLPFAGNLIKWKLSGSK